MRIRRAAWLLTCVTLLIIPALTACSGKNLTPPTVETAVIATPSGPTPTPLANVLRGTPAAPLATSRPPAPAAGPSAGAPRVVIKEFYDALLAKRNIAAFLTSELRATTDGDGYAILRVQPPMRSFSVDSQEVGADGATATVGSTLSAASGTTNPRFAMTKHGNTWLIVQITT